MNRYVKGAILASSVAGLMFSTIACGPSTGTNTDKIKCSGVNECKGQGGCNGTNSDGTTHDCAGKNACKGQGWLELTKDECTTKGGTVVQ